MGYLLIVNSVMLLTILANPRKYFPVFAHLIFLSMYSFGFYNVGNRLGFPNYSWINLLAPTWLIIGIHLGRLLEKKQQKALITKEDVQQKAFNAVLVIFAVLTFYHFARVGIVVLSNEIETERFLSLADSGLFGLPGRIVLFALPALALSALIKRHTLSNRSVISSWLLFTVSNFFLGFKGALIEVIIVCVIGLTISDYKTIMRNKRKVLIAFSVAAGYAAWTASLYITFKTNLSFNLNYIFKRFTDIPALPQWVALNLNQLGLNTGGALRSDFDYFINKYFGFGTGQNFAFDQVVSSIVYNTPRRASSFLVPVTTGGAAYLILSFVWWIAIVIIIGLGFLVSSILQTLRSGCSLSKTILLSYLLLMVLLFMTNGAGAYLIINNLAMIILTLLLYRIGCILFDKSKIQFS